MRLSLIAAIGTIGLLPVAALGSVISIENFEGITDKLDVTSAGAFSAINGTNIDIVGLGSGFGSCLSPEYGSCIDMDGTGGISAGQLQSNAAFGPGNYLLSFDLIGSQRGASSSVTVTFGNYNQTFNLASSDVTHGIVLNAPVTVTGSSHLLFVSNDPLTDEIGELLDNVVVSTPDSSAPEPSSMLLLGSGLLLGAIVRARRHRA